MSVAERLRLIEEIWDSLRDDPGAIEVPAWHREILDHRHSGYAEVAANARPWADVRSEILKTLRKA